MAMTLDEIQALLESGGLKVVRREDTIVTGFATETYRDARDEKGLALVIRLEENGEYFKLFAPQAFKARGPNTDAVLRSCMMIQWKTKMLQFEYDESDGEIRPIVEFALEDNKLTDRQLRRCMSAIVGVVDKFFPILKTAIDGGIVDFGDKPAAEREGQIQALRRIIHDLEGTGSSAEQVAALKAALAQLEAPPTRI